MRVLFLALVLVLLGGGAQSRAAELPECIDVFAGPCRLPTTMSLETAETRLGPRQTVWWADGAVFNILARHPGDSVELCCSLQEALTRIGDNDIWGLSVRVPRLQEAVIDIRLLPPIATTGELRAEVWRGPLAPPAPPRAEPLAGVVADHIIDSEVMGERRKVSVYLPRFTGAGAAPPAVYMADGGAVHGYAPIVDALISEGRIPPVVLVGDWSGPEGKRKPDDPDWRAMEYLAGFPGGEARFAAHRRFVTDELVPWAEQRFRVSSAPGDRIVAGQSNGGAWALGVLREQPDVFRNAILMSPAGREPQFLESLAGSRIFLGAGSLESVLADRVPRIASGAQLAGAATSLVLPVGGHSSEVWDMVFAAGLIWLLGQ